ncbi:MAG: nitroreductase family deazaflavin-dependent oxidoreductase [Chloroflexi bacterium]|nr:MAG: nitroreductase family deazaflavin-dependent oxidoreductase [Chloroflexota bacterium]
MTSQEAQQLDERVIGALARGGTIDITTVGRKSGTPRRLEIVFHNIDGRIYISGIPSPTRRGWLANLEANPRFTFHLKGAVRADLPATARIIDTEDERRRILAGVARNWRRTDVDRMVLQSPLIEVQLDGAAINSDHSPTPA